MAEKRDLTAGMEAEVQKDTVYPILLLEGEFTTGTARFWTGLGELSWNGQTWQGLGDLVAISNIDETVEVAAKGFAVSISGQNASNISLALQSCRQGAAGRFWLGLLDAAGAVIADPYLVREGRLDVPAMSDNGESATITISYEDRLIDLERPREFRWTTESQRLFYPNDLGFEFVPSLQDAVDVWLPA